MKPTIISFVRHGEVYNPQGIYYGRLPRFRLSENGRNQAAATANLLQSQHVAAIYSSPLLRARQTAQIIGERVQQPIHYSKQLLEAYTPSDGQSIASLAATNWDVYTKSPPEYEQPEGVAARIVSLITRIRRIYAGQHVVAVAHADVLAFTALWAANSPITVSGRNQLRQIGLIDDFPGYASILSLSFNRSEERPYQIKYQRSPAMTEP